VEGMLKQGWKASGLGGPMTFKTWCIVDTEDDDVLAYCIVAAATCFQVCPSQHAAMRSLLNVRSISVLYADSLEFTSVRIRSLPSS
jgi:hypothetical protein